MSPDKKLVNGFIKKRGLPYELDKNFIHALGEVLSGGHRQHWLK